MVGRGVATGAWGYEMRYLAWPSGLKGQRVALTGTLLKKHKFYLETYELYAVLIVLYKKLLKV